MRVPFYDSQNPLDDPTTADVVRVYCLDWHQFGENEWAALGRVYGELPAYQGVHQSVPWWFGTDENDIPHLVASVEPPGLQVCGILPADAWTTWVSLFETGIADLPSYDPDD